MTAKFCEEAVYTCPQREDKTYDSKSFQYRENLFFLTPSVDDCPFQVTFGTNDRPLTFVEKKSVNGCKTRGIHLFWMINVYCIQRQ